MQISIYDYEDYKAYLRDWILSRPRGGRGEKRRIAEALRCHTAYVTHVFRGDAQFSLEQASDLSGYIGHTPEDQHYFLLLVQWARAANQSFKSYLEREIRKVHSARLVLKNRIRFSRKLSEKDQVVYYSAWYYSAIYALASVPGFQTADEIARYFHLPLTLVTGVLEFLMANGLIIREGKGYNAGTTSIHLGSDSPMIAKHHTNWRIQAIRSLDHPRMTDLHYSSVVSLAREDVPKVRAILFKTIEEIRATVKDSPEETVQAYALDLFGLAE